MSYSRNFGANTEPPKNQNSNANSTHAIQEWAPTIFDTIFGKSDEEKLAAMRARLVYLKQAEKVSPMIFGPQVQKLEEQIKVLEEGAQAERETRMFMRVYKVGGAILLIGLPLAGIYYLVKKAGK